jgi:hypothetical protein
MGRQAPQPAVVILMQAGLVIVYEDGGRDMHCKNKNEPLFDSTFSQAGFHLRCDVYESPSSWNVEPEFFTKRFHLSLGRNLRQ